MQCGGLTPLCLSCPRRGIRPPRLTAPDDCAAHTGVPSEEAYNYHAPMIARTTEEDPSHARFLDLCFLYSDFNRPVFLEAILHCFIESAGPSELKSLRRGIRDREKALPRNGRKGRPRAEHDWNWIRRSARLAWQREILHWSWSGIAAAAGMKPTKPNIRTLHNRLDRYAVLVWKATPGPSSEPDVLAKTLQARHIQLLFRSRTALPFDTHPEECRKIVLKLAPRGKEVVANELDLPVIRRYRSRKRRTVSDM